MKKIFITALALVSISAYAREYSCVATLTSYEKVEQANLEMISEPETVRIITIGSMQFNATETNDETIVLSIFNRAKREQSATATTFVPKEGKPSNLILRLADGSATINCESK